jgi:hypothetical protein
MHNCFFFSFKKISFLAPLIFFLLLKADETRVVLICFFPENLLVIFFWGGVINYWLCDKHKIFFFPWNGSIWDPKKSDVTEPINKYDTPKPDKARLMTRYPWFHEKYFFFREICCCEFFRGCEYQNSETTNFFESQKSLLPNQELQKKNFVFFIIYQPKNCTLL